MSCASCGILEVPAARLAARNRSGEDLQALHDAIPANPRDVGGSEVMRYGQDFHSRVVLSAHSKLLRIAAEPVHVTVLTRVSTTQLHPGFHAHVAEDHRAIAAAIAARDEDRAAEAMSQHLQYLRPTFERAWRREES